MPFFRIQLTLHLKGPVVSRSTGPGAVGLDTVMCRTPREKPAIPGSLVQGRLSEAWQALAAEGIALSTNDKARWLGANPGDDATDASGLMAFPLYSVGPDGHQGRQRVRIEVDDERGAASDQMMQMIEDLYGSGENVPFSGIVELKETSDQEAERARKALVLGLQACVSMGAFEGVGFGRVSQIEAVMQAVKPAPIDPASLVSAGVTKTVGIRVMFDRPLCVAEPQPIQNLFRSADVIPGAVLKGALARFWSDVAALPRGQASFPNSPALTNGYHAVRFTHAHPQTRNAATRGSVVPLSTAIVDGILVDLATVDGPGLVSGRAPSFKKDWKKDDWTKANAGFDVRDVRHLLEIRHAHDTALRRANEGQLYAYDMAVPDDGLEWYTEVSAEDPVVLADAVKAISAYGGFHDVGKTRAAGAVDFVAPVPPTDRLRSVAEPREGLWIVTLQTPALLCVAETLNESSGAKALHDVYDKAWKELSDSGLELVRFFAEQRLAGGWFLHRRFGKNHYRPYLLTAPGSVFVLRAAKGASATALKTLVQHWIDRGLHLPESVAASYDATGADAWRRCPYVPENGFGEVRVNMPVHWDLAPVSQGMEFEPLDSTWAITEAGV